MARLTPKTYWDAVHESEQSFYSGGEKNERRSGLPFRKRATRALKKLLGEPVRERMSAYDDYLLWQVIFPRYLSQLNGAKVVEIGSAPGEYVAEFCRRYGCVPCCTSE